MAAHLSINGQMTQGSWLMPRCSITRAVEEGFQALPPQLSRSWDLDQSGQSAATGQTTPFPVRRQAASWRPSGRSSRARTTRADDFADQEAGSARRHAARGERSVTLEVVLGRQIRRTGQRRGRPLRPPGQAEWLDRAFSADDLLMAHALQPVKGPGLLDLMGTFWATLPKARPGRPICPPSTHSGWWPLTGHRAAHEGHSGPGATVADLVLVPSRQRGNE